MTTTTTTTCEWCALPNDECYCDERCDHCDYELDDCICDEECPGGCGAALRRCQCDAIYEAWAGK